MTTRTVLWRWHFDFFVTSFTSQFCTFPHRYSGIKEKANELQVFRNQFVESSTKSTSLKMIKSILSLALIVCGITNPVISQYPGWLVPIGNVGPKTYYNSSESGPVRTYIQYADAIINNSILSCLHIKIKKIYHNFSKF